MLQMFSHLRRPALLWVLRRLPPACGCLSVRLFVAAVVSSAAPALDGRHPAAARRAVRCGR